MAAVYAYNVLTNRDQQSTKYIERYADHVPASVALKQAAQTVPAASASASGESAELTGPYAPLMKAVEKGLKGDAAAQTKALLAEKQPLEVVDEALIPALDIVGAKYEKGTLFLPQLLQAASAAQSAFEEIKNVIAQKGEGSASKGRIVLATVKGDVHDIGKNIVSVVLACNGYRVEDLGVMVESERIVETAVRQQADVIGLSGLITPSLEEMAKVIVAVEQMGLRIPILIGGATTSASDDVRVLAELGSVRREEYLRSVRERQQRLREEFERRDAGAYRSLAEARARKPAIDWTRVPVPRKTGRYLFCNYPLEELVPLVNWSYFFSAWGLPGRYPALFDDPKRGEEARRVFDDAQRLLSEIVDRRLLRADGVIGLYPAASDGDDIVLYADESRERERMRLPQLRNQQADRERNLSLADFVAPLGSGVKDYVGAFAVTAGLGLEELAGRYRSEGDDYRAIMAKLLADRLTEAFAEALHRYARVTLWGYEREGQWSVGDLLAEKYQGIRPAFGYPSAPDHSLKADVFALMDVGTVTGMTMTESYMIVPGEAACGLMLGHPEARNFSVGRIDSEQLASYAARRGTDPEKMRVLIPQHLIDM